MTGSPASHSAAVWDLVADEPVAADDQPDGVGRLERLCRAATRDLPAMGVGVSLLSESGDLLRAAASSCTSAMVEELQFTMGEGPCLAAFAARSPILVPDLNEMSETTWQGYAPAAHDRGVRAVFAFPLQVGAARLGVLDVYRQVPGSLTMWALSRAMAYAEAATETMLDAEDHDGQMADFLSDATDLRFEVYQAQGVVSVQLGVLLDVALARMRAHAYGHGRLLGDVADDILAHRLFLEHDGPAL